MRRLWVLAVLVSFMLPAALCGEEGEGPKETLLSFQKHLRLEAYRLATDFLSNDSLDMVKVGGNNPSDWLRKEMGDDFHKTFKIISIEQEGDWATAKVKMPNENTSGNFYLVKEKGVWKISFVPKEQIEAIRIMVKEAGREKAEKAAQKELKK